ncbi:high-temperature-induced dauer-formation protein-domain-containing protein [Radiomyces spectabilis]|uniref:high-temperature-induced dauer-formation protein-domain-containing protein n=1 Tax=Radiomyces spectabilis TaxID=64574 RepID=UPI00221F2E5A|nr:high-temperature-induced dauer-formation protein-domain-containing protein [Radiomyces spectabilis]KAI8391567.1 high-temperature-induced dauer-formation protein-domain-containing protein [Radiomyces spectabilis]
MGAAESKLAFRQTVLRLFEERNIAASDEAFWSQFWEVPESMDHVFSSFGASDIRRLRDSARENLETLLDKLLDKMEAHVNAINATPEKFPSQHLLNCCRVMARIMPFIFEDTDSQEWETSFFWTPVAAGQKSDPQIEKEGDADVENSSASKSVEQSVTRGQRLLSLTVRCLFLSGFTLPASLTTKESRTAYVIWEPGVGSSVSVGNEQQHLLHRIEVLRLLIVLLSKSIYVLPDEQMSFDNPWLSYVIKNMDRKTVLVLLCSLMNTACQYDPVGWGVPYNYLLVADPREQLADKCLRLLLILLDGQSPRDSPAFFGEKSTPVVPTDDTASNKGSPTEQESVGRNSISNGSVTSEMDTSVHDNAFRHHLSKLHRSQDFNFLATGMYRVLVNPLQASNTYLPGSTKRVSCHVEMVMLFWRLCDINPRFTAHLTKNKQIMDFIVVLIFYAMENKLQAAHIDVVRMCTYILQCLSSERTVCILLNQQFTTQASLPPVVRIPAFYGTYGDFLVISIFNLIANSRGTLASLYPSLVLTITNASPYLKNLSISASGKLVSLFNSVSTPGYLFAGEYNHDILGFLLEAFNNLIQYQFSDNPNLIYALVRNHVKFEKLRDFSYDEAVNQLKRSRKRNSESLPTMEKEKTTEIRSSDEQSNSPDNVELASSVSLKESETTDVTSTSTSQPQDSAIIHRNLPSKEWVMQWYAQLPLQPVLLLLEHVLPQVEAKCSIESLTTDQEVLAFLRTMTLVGVLPPPQPLHVRRFYWAEAMVVWLRSVLWGHAYLSSLKDCGLWNGTHIRLFYIQQSEPPQSSTESETQQQQEAK